MNLTWNLETYLSIITIVLSSIGIIYIIRINRRSYGLLWLISAIVGESLCYFFVKIGLYSFPYRLFPQVSLMPLLVVLTLFPFLVLIGVRYSPSLWMWKIPFYWVIVHLGMLAETWAQNQTELIKYELFWDVWDSYTWWWIYLLIFEWVGGMIVPKQFRNPIRQESLEYGEVLWFIMHFILIGTIFLAGFYLGRVTSN